MDFMNPINKTIDLAFEGQWKDIPDEAWKSTTGIFEGAGEWYQANNDQKNIIIIEGSKRLEEATKATIAEIDKQSKQINEMASNTTRQAETLLDASKDIVSNAFSGLFKR
jgi:hypothetical protein